MACLTYSGEFTFLGRHDLQVQIRGNRVELAELERVVLKHPGVANAAAITLNGGGGDELAVCVVPAGPGLLTEAALRSHCRERLPDYMVPRYVVFTPSLPLLVNGKLDREALSSLVTEGRPRNNSSD
jgi:acyl-coenzyme A synthetase/AMP-(fatty) acid ligase